MQKECLPQPQPQEIQIVPLVPESAITAMHQAFLDMLQALPVPITITEQVDERTNRPYYMYQVGETTQDNPVGMCIGAQWQFLDAVRVSLEAAMRQTNT